MFAFDPARQDSPNVQGMRTLGTGELELSHLQDLIKVGHAVLAFLRPEFLITAIIYSKGKNTHG